MATMKPKKSETFVIGHHTIRCLHDLRALEIDRHHQVHLTPTEYRVMLLLLQGPVDDMQLAELIFGTEGDFWTREALDKHMDNLRRKFKKQRINLYIHRLKSCGYVLAPLYAERRATHNRKRDCA